MKNIFQDKNIVITGASSGIGKSLAEHLAQLGANLFLIARRKNLLDEIITALPKKEGQHFEAVSLDITERISVEKTLKEIDQRYPVDFLFNNAGIAFSHYAEKTDIGVFEKMISTNYLGMVYATQSLLSQMKKRGSGHIVNVGSICSLLSFVGYSAYAPSKFAVRAYSDALRNELKGTGVKISLLLPGDTNTPQFEEENRTKPLETSAIAGKVKLLEPEAVALSCLRGVARRQYRILPGTDAKFTAFIAMNLPWVFEKFADRVVANTRRQKP